MSEPLRPVFRDRLYHNYNGDSRPNFDITDPTLPILNRLRQTGTLVNSGTMNNLIDMDNWGAFSGAIHDVIGLSLNSTEIIETLRDKGAGSRLLARRIGTLTTGVWEVIEQLYDLNEFGTNVIVQTRVYKMNRTGVGSWVGDVT
jgi:hypothetical protein